MTESGTEETTDISKPEVVAPEDMPKPPVAPAAVHPDAVETTPSGLKFGWQVPPRRGVVDPATCIHMGTIQAKMQLFLFEVGDEWVCTCGKLFEVVVNTGGKKTLKEKNDS